jgi:hypothetical protein
LRIGLLYRLKGEALLAGAGTVSEAETAIEKGIEVAHRQNTKSWELRGVMSLARLRRQLVPLPSQVGSLLRLETTTNDVSAFKHYRKVEHRQEPATRAVAPSER